MNTILTSLYSVSALEWSANIMTAVCIILAGRNNVYTWWTGIVACALFGVLFYDFKLYADAQLQLFFIATSIVGWYGWSSTKTNAFTTAKIKFGPRHRNYGICFNIQTTPAKCEVAEDELTNIFKTWEHYSGHAGYPIPEKPLTKWQRFRVKYLGAIVGDPRRKYRTRNSMCDKETEYGQLRWDLLKHIIKETA